METKWDKPHQTLISTHLKWDKPHQTHISTHLK